MLDYVINIIAKINTYFSKSRIEPSVKQKRDFKGNVYWQVYDPVSKINSSFASEGEVKSWLDSRYYD